MKATAKQSHSNICYAVHLIDENHLYLHLENDLTMKHICKKVHS